MPGKAQYQVVLLGLNAAHYRRRFVANLKRRLREIGVGLDARLLVMSATSAASRDLISPCVAVWFGDDPTFDTLVLDALLAAAVPVLPVVSDLEHYKACTPATLHPINGMAVKSTAPDFGQVTNLVLENLGFDVLP